MVSGGARFGAPDETISSVMGKNMRKDVCAFCFYLCVLLHFFDKDHCAKSIELDEGKPRR